MVRHWLQLRKAVRLIAELKKRIAALERQLSVERERHTAREDFLVDRILTAAGQYAITKQVKDATRGSQPVPARAERLSAYDEAVRQAYRDEASAAGKTMREADDRFEAWRTGRSPRGEMPYMVEDAV